MRQTWRWFGPADRIRMDEIMQAGVEGIVTALHHIPAGAVWTPEEIAKRQHEVATRQDGLPTGLAWEVVESLPVSEAIKQQTGLWRAHIEAWKQSMRHIAAAGIKVICYNFMPVLDWTRTDLAWPRPSGARCMRFDLIDFAVFDIHILARQQAALAFPADVTEEAARRFASMPAARRTQLAQTVAFGLPGAADHFGLADIRACLAQYDQIDADRLRRHLIDFLAEVTPLAEQLGLRLCCHPDDPPFPLLGLPRIMSTPEDYAAVLAAVNLPANGITLCTGSLGARTSTDCVRMMRELGGRVHFLHLRNVTIEGTAPLQNSFYEDEHLSGRLDMAAMVCAIVEEEARRRAAGRADHSIPMRPDHGQDILDDLERSAQPGYPLIGRLKGLAELRGLFKAFEYVQQVGKQAATDRAA